MEGKFDSNRHKKMEGKCDSIAINCICQNNGRKSILNSKLFQKVFSKKLNVMKRIFKNSLLSTVPYTTKCIILLPKFYNYIGIYLRCY